MTTWKCNDCDRTFDEPDSVLFRQGRIGNGSENWEQDEYKDVCPFCGCEDFYEITVCAECEAVQEFVKKVDPKAQEEHND